MVVGSSPFGRRSASIITLFPGHVTILEVTQAREMRVEHFHQLKMQWISAWSVIFSKLAPPVTPRVFGVQQSAIHQRKAIDAPVKNSYRKQRSAGQVSCTALTCRERVVCDNSF